MEGSLRGVVRPSTMYFTSRVTKSGNNVKNRTKQQKEHQLWLGPLDTIRTQRRPIAIKEEKKRFEVTKQLKMSRNPLSP